MKGIEVQDHNVRAPGLAHHEGQTVAAKLVISDSQHISQPQSGAIGYQDVRRQKHSPWAVAETPRHLRGYRKKLPDLVVRPSADNRQGPFDPSKGPCYTAVHQQAVLGGGTTERVQHPAMVGDGGGSEMREGVGQVGVDAVSRKVFDLPRQALAEDAKLLPVSGGAARSSVVGNGVVQQTHGRVALVANNTPHFESGTPSSIGYCGYSPLLVGGRTILRVLWVALLATLIFLHQTGLALTALLLGQFGVALVEWRRLCRRR